MRLTQDSETNSYLMQKWYGKCRNFDKITLEISSNLELLRSVVKKPRVWLISSIKPHTYYLEKSTHTHTISIVQSVAFTWSHSGSIYLTSDNVSSEYILFEHFPYSVAHRFHHRLIIHFPLKSFSASKIVRFRT